MKSNIYVSSLAFLDQSVEEIMEICALNNYNLEFSSGMPFRQNMDQIYLDAKIQRMPHNYFPDPEIPFVLNLASSNLEIRRQSIEHCKRGLKLAKESNSPFYAAHAGFCIDPKPSELGRKIAIQSEIDKGINKEHFLNSVFEILDVAEELEISFLIENNVLAPFNYNGENPLLCCEFNDISWLFENVIHKRFGLLLDTAHLKVSCRTLNLDLLEQFEKISPFVNAFHHSDNDGTVDSNLPLDSNYWFLKYFKNYKDYVHVLEIKSLNTFEIESHIKLFEKNGN
ncbi:sugar phosphate isomerase/epimerase [Flavobacterium sp. LC2016-12]|uniref:sugar phosphate isomerase/epimerase family protein n=1 Tax=Flavobacterium sp. LC2016-12 TaxID=2783794 RepID=UPI00188CB0E5|nr:TIM barrel protein [Flavobacterium sp. LC2016-12]MBF4465685.1 sugar phosphate isomerase/epimerase [Flavobacterium sp. LC2016-12]